MKVISCEDDRKKFNKDQNNKKLFVMQGKINWIMRENYFVF